MNRRSFALLSSVFSLCFFCTTLVAPPAFAKTQHPIGKAQRRKAANRHSRARHRVAVRPVSVYTRDGGPNIQAQAAVVVDMKSDLELFQKNPDAVRPIASISKLMAMIVVLDHPLDLEAITEMAPSDRDLARRGARSRLPTGMQFTNRDLLHAALMASDNRAVPALGRAVGLDPEHLTAEMNKKAIALGLTHTTFGDPTGLDQRNRSTPREVAAMLRAALKIPLISEITRKKQYTARCATRPGYCIQYNNTDVIARGGKFTVLGGKTGYTDLAGYCLAIAARLNTKGGEDRDVAMVFLGAQGKLTRFGDFNRAAQWLAEKTPPALKHTAL